jgi:hypothetical protein
MTNGQRMSLVSQRSPLAVSSSNTIEWNSGFFRISTPPLLPFAFVEFSFHSLRQTNKQEKMPKCAWCNSPASLKCGGGCVGHYLCDNPLCADSDWNIAGHRIECKKMNQIQKLAANVSKPKKVFVATEASFYY